MFTGIIEEIGQIVAIEKNGKSAKLTISAKKILEDICLGDSIAVNGICLTACYISKQHFIADVMVETMNRSNLGSLQKGSHVNLERAMSANGRFGGHIVSGHVDGIGTIIHLKREENAIWVTIKTNEKILKYVVEKGSIAIDGISLTVASLFSSCFTVSIIPHTSSMTILKERQVGDLVNLENDIIGKYVERLQNPLTSTEKKSNITQEFLSKYGF